MKIVSILSFLVGAVGIFAGFNLYGDIGVTSIIAGIIGVLSGIGFWIQASKN